MKPIKVDFEKRAIIMTREFAISASDPYSNEFAILQDTIKSFPGFHVQRHTIKQKVGRECYKGLTYEWMRNYIETHDETALAEFNELMLLSKCHSRRYPVIKKWFLDRFEEVKMYGVDKVETTGKVVEALSFKDIA